MTRTASFLICDEVREEISGKLIFVGVYRNNILLPNIPATLNKLTFLVKVRTPLEEPLQKMSVRIERPGVEKFIRNFTIPYFEPKLPSVEGTKYRENTAQFSIEPFEVPEAGRIAMFVDTERETLYAGSLPIEQIPSSQIASANKINSALSMLAWASLAKFKYEQLFSEQSESILKELVSQVPEELRDQLLKFENSVIQTGPNEFRVWFHTPMRKTPNISITKIPEGVTYDLSSISKLGFKIRFEPADILVEGFEFSADAEL